MRGANEATRLLAVVFSVLMITSAMGIGAMFSVGVAQGQTAGETLYQANAGGSFTADGDTWDPLIDYQVAGEDETSSHGQPSAIDDSVPSDTPTQIWETERWDPDGGEEMQYEFSVPDGQQVEVRLYFYDGYSGTSSVGDRVFDVSVEDQTVEEFDVIEAYGDDTGGMKSFTVTSDGTIDVDFAHVTENPQVNAIEIVAAEPEPDTLGGPSDVDFGSVVTGQTESETVTVTNLGGDGDSSIDISGVSVSGDAAFSAGSASQTTLAPGESADIPVTFSPSEVATKSATLEISHTGSNSPLTVDLTGEGASAVDPGFSKSQLQGFSASNPTAIDFGPDGRAYVSTQGGTVYALAVERTGENSYQVVNEVQIDAIKDIPNHDDLGNLESGETNRQITGITAGGTAENPVVYVSSSDPEIDVGQDDDDTDTNSGAISRLTISPGSDDTLQASEVSHDVMVLGLPRSEENHATNGIDLSADGDTMYVAQGGHTNKGAPGDNFGHTPEYALSAAILEIDLAQIESNYQAKNLQNYDSDYPDLSFYYGIPTIQNDDATDGDDLPFGGNDGINQAKLVEGGPVQIYSPGYRNPYDLVVTESGQVYAADHGPNGGWGGQPADATGSIVADAASVTNHPNEDGSFSTNDQLVKVDEGDYGGHAAPIRANPTGADIYDANGNVIFDINASNSPVPSSMVNPVEADYIPPTSDSPDPGAPAGSANTMEFEDGDPVLFGPTGATTEYTASNFGGAMQGDLVQVELGGDIERVELSDDGTTVTNVETIANTNGPLGATAQGDDEVFAGTVWTANHGSGGLTVLEPVDYGDNDSDGGTQCTGADDASLDEDGDGYDNADEIDAGTDPCSSASTPADFDDDGTSNLNDPDDDNDGLDDTEDPFAVDASNGMDTTLPVEHDLSELSLFGENGQGWTGLMMNGSNYQDLYDPTQMTVGGAAEVLTVEQVPPGDAYSNTNTQQYGFQFGADTPDEPFTVETTVSSFPDSPENYQSAGLFLGTGDQSNYTKLVVAADGGNGGVEFAKEVDDSFTHPSSPNVVSDSAVTTSQTTLRMTVDPTTDPAPDNGVEEVAVTAEYEVAGNTTEVGTAAVPASWFDTSDGVAPAFGVISTSNGASSTFSATWTDISVEYVTPPENQPPTADAGADQTVDEGADVTLDASGSDDPDGDQLGYTWTQTAGPDVSLSVNDGEQTTFTAPEVDAETTLTFEVNVSDGEDTDADTVNVTVQDTDTAPAEGEVVYRVNAGGQEVAATDGGPAWSADTDVSPSQYVNADGDNGLNTYSTGDTITLDGSVPSSTPASVFQTERYDENTSGSAADDTEMQWSFDAEQGATYEVRLYFAEIFLDSSNVGTQGPRTFDVVVEGQTELDDYNIYQQYGHDVGAMESFEVTPSDGTIDVAFLHEQENPKISAIEVVKVSDSSGSGDMTVAEAVASYDDDGDDTQIENEEIQAAVNWWTTGSEVPNTGGETISNSQIQQLVNMWATGATVGDGSGDDGDTATGSALVEVTPDTGLETSTYGSGSYQVTNTGEKNISSVSFDLDTATLPDMVFDPQGTAGDPTGEGLNIADDGGTNITTEPGSGEAFSEPHNGQNADDGYDVMTVEFADFESGETATFWADNDPTSIKGATVGSQEAGPVSGLELARSTVTVTYEDGTTQTTQLMGDGSAGGSTAVVTDSEAPAPTIGAQDVSLDDTALDDYHSAATVSSADQTVTVTGEPGETVTLVRVEGELTLTNVPDADGDGEPGYEIEAYEANDAEAVEYYSVTLDGDGEAAVPVTLTNTTGDSDAGNAGYNYFVAAHGEASGDMGLASNVVVLKYEEGTDDGDTGGSGDVAFAVNAGGSEYTATDGTVYQADTNFDGGSAYDTTQAIGDTQNDPLYQTERYGDFWYNASAPNGTYEVTLEFAEIYHGTSQDNNDVNGDGTNVGDRLFDVNAEGQQVLNDYDIYANAGALNATNETVTVEVTDGELNLEFVTESDNAKVSAIKVAAAEDGSGGSSGTASADFAVNANGGVDASTYGSGSFEIANTGDQQISSVTYDLSSAAFPDVVFDPQGTAGDSGAKGFTPDSGASAVSPSGSFAAPHNGQNGDDGYDELTVDFGDFEGDESFAFSTDIDPTSIKDASGTGAAGSVSGLELSGATVTVEYADGTTQTTNLFGDGSSGGSQAAAKADVPAAPTTGAEGVTLDSSALDSQHSAATVSSADQTVTVSGPAGATVQLLHVEGQLELANQADGYDLEAYEANTAENVGYQTVQLDSNGQATVDVTLTNTSGSGVEGGFNYFVAAVEDGSGDTGATSNVVVMKYSEGSDSSGTQVLHRVNAGEGTTLSATDDGPDWIGVADTSSPYLASVANSSAGTYCSGSITATTAAVPSSTPDAVYDCERYGNSTWEFSVDSGQQVEVRLYVGNQFSGTSEPGDRDFNVSVEGQQVLTNYDPVADVGHQTGTMKNFTVTEDGDGAITVTFDKGASENPQVNAIEIVEGGSA
ncbi:choice-of-anchor D domain-containing protein [Halomicroarcula limicola]|uniref:Choice-of-anchor D domain-containing protein n=1 Tax=Haloarcula limicola TaxID=1429915 RepID=A0A8J7YCR7_9EURY|nr:malectin domain-containing carbohydrate-binding protein [Halomicroarcula limicola]MBV0924113.1 choice-of-anchor D domain-containing protein [Halomicroarcula limicola]